MKSRTQHFFIHLLVSTTQHTTFFFFFPFLSSLSFSSFLSSFVPKMLPLHTSSRIRTDSWVPEYIRRIFYYPQVRPSLPFPLFFFFVLTNPGSSSRFSFTDGPRVHLLADVCPVRRSVQSVSPFFPSIIFIFFIFFSDPIMSCLVHLLPCFPFSGTSHQLPNDPLHHKA